MAKPPPKRGTTKAQRKAADMRKAGVDVSWMDPVRPKEGAAPRFGVNPAGGGKTKAQIDRERANKTPRFGIEPAGGGKTKAQVERERVSKAQKQAAYDDHVENLRKLGDMPDAPDEAYGDKSWGPKYEKKDLGWQQADGTAYNESAQSAPSKEELAAEREIVDAKEKAQQKAARQASTKRTRAQKATGVTPTKAAVRRPSPAPAVTPAAPKAKAPDRATNVRNSKALPKPDKTLYTAPRTYTKPAEAPRAAGRSPAPKPKLTYKVLETLPGGSPGVKGQAPKAKTKHPFTGRRQYGYRFDPKEGSWYEDPSRERLKPAEPKRKLLKDMNAKELAEYDAAGAKKTAEYNKREKAKQLAYNAEQRAKNPLDPSKKNDGPLEALKRELKEASDRRLGIAKKKPVESPQTVAKEDVKTKDLLKTLKAKDAAKRAKPYEAPKPNVPKKLGGSPGVKGVIKGAAKALGPIGAVISLAMGADIAEASGFQVDSAGSPDPNPRDRNNWYYEDHPKERVRHLARLQTRAKKDKADKLAESARRSGSQFRSGTFNVNAGSKAPVRKKK